MNVEDRQHEKFGGRGYAITGHREIMASLLAALLIEMASDRDRGLRMNVEDRQHAKSGGRGYAITSHHEIMAPLLIEMGQ